MKFRFLFLAIVVAALCASCIKEEAPNAEADIIECWLDRDVMLRAPQIENDSITITVKDGVNVTRLAPQFRLTEGATIEPASGTVRNFSTVQYYVVTSQDGHWAKRYAVRVVAADFSGDAADTLITFSFETVKNKGTLVTYPVFYETDLPLLGSFDWASGNAGYALTGMASSAEKFPTHLSTNGYEGSCAELVTCSAGSFGAMADKPMAAGNLFLGSFDMGKAMSSPLESTLFGMSIAAEPIMMEGWMNYKAGETFYVADASASDGIRAVPDRVDRCDIYAIFFEPTEDMPYLTGDNPRSESNPNIISVATLPEAQTATTDGWVHFEMPFVMRAGKAIDADKLRHGGYSIALVFSSSAGGAEFQGALDSRLQIDNVAIKFRPKK